MRFGANRPSSSESKYRDLIFLMPGLGVSVHAFPNDAPEFRHEVYQTERGPDSRRSVADARYDFRLPRCGSAGAVRTGVVTGGDVGDDEDSNRSSISDNAAARR